MIRYNFRFKNEPDRLLHANEQFVSKFLGYAGGTIRKMTLASFQREPQKHIHSPKGQPPFAHKPKGQFLRPAILYAVNKLEKSVIIGTVYSVAKFWGKKHEHGGLDHGHTYPKRPFMSPQLRRFRHMIPSAIERIGNEVYR